MTPKPPHFRKIANSHGYGYILDKNPELTSEELLAIECEELREAVRLPMSIVENIGKHMSMAQHPVREIEKAAIAAIDGEMELAEKLYHALDEVGCLVALGCTDEVGYCCVCVGLNAYREARR